MNLRRGELREEVSELAKRLEDLNDAEESIIMADESTPGATKVMVGEAFVDVDSESATEFLNKELNNAKKLKETSDKELMEIESRMGILKKALYARFGKGINLEEQ